MNEPVKISEEINKAIFENYNLLSDSGLLQYIETLNHDIVNRNELLNEALEIFNRKSISDLVHYITSKFLNKFVPETLTFIVPDEILHDKPVVISYKNLKLVESDLVLEDFSIYKEFFMLSPSSVTFEAFEVMLDDPQYTELFEVLNPELLVPIMGIEGVYGFIIFGKKVTFKPFDSAEIHFIDQIMKFVSISLQNIIHYKRAITDLKTKLYNHDYFMQSFNRELTRMKRYGGEIGILIMDIDHFKKVNDTYGHVAGDKIIQLVAKSVSSVVRGEDIAARFGGEEFVVMLTQCKRDNVLDVAERIRKKIEKYKISFNGSTFRITISIGGIHVLSSCLDSAEDILKNVDKTLYYCKENGRNCSFLYNDIFP